MLKVLKEIIIIILQVVAAVILCLFIFGAGITRILEITFPNDYLFYEFQGSAEELLVPIIMVPILFVVGFYGSIKKQWREKKKGFIIGVIVLLLGLYYCFTSLAIATEDGVIRRTPLHPIGTEYKYADVERIQTGFGDKKDIFFTPEHEKLGNFYYKIYIDGKETVFHSPYPNPDIERYEDSYLELEEFDQKLESLEIPKEGNPDGAGLCDMDQCYVDRFLRIISENS